VQGVERERATQRRLRFAPARGQQGLLAFLEECFGLGALTVADGGGAIEQRRTGAQERQRTHDRNDIAIRPAAP
jgi:hypothetical protein